MFMFTIFYFDGILYGYIVNVLFVLLLLGIFSFQIKINSRSELLQLNFNLNICIMGITCSYTDSSKTLPDLSACFHQHIQF